MCAEAARHKWVPAPTRQASMPVCVRHFDHTYYPWHAWTDRLPPCLLECKPQEKRAKRDVSLDHHGRQIDRARAQADDGRLPELSFPACLSAFDYCAADRALMQCCCHACMCVQGGEVCTHAWRRSEWPVPTSSRAGLLLSCLSLLGASSSKAAIG